MPKTIGIIWGKLKGKDKPSDNPIPQALRFPVKYWTAEKAKKWLKDNNIKYQRFEPAKKEKDSSAASVDIIASVNIYALIAQLETQFWAMDPRALQGLFNNLAKQEIYLPDDIQIAGKDKIKDLRIEGAVAIIDIKGILIREIPRAFYIWGIEATSYDDISRQVVEAVNDEKVTSILLKVDSPGGTVLGAMETADVIRAARDKKPVDAVVDDIGASSAYWLASQANRIDAKANSNVGSIGVYTVYVDSSKRADDLGFKVHIIRSGEHKGMGIPGVEITEKQIAAIQEIIDGIAKNFIDGVAKGRQREKKEVRELATGQLWLADKAVRLGLIDGILENQLLNKVNQRKGKTMSEEQEKIDAQAELNQLSENVKDEERKRLGELKMAFPDDLDVALKAFEEGKTVLEAKAEHHDVLDKKLKEKDASKEVKPEEVIGAKAISSGSSDNEQEGDFLEEAHKLVDDGKAKSMTEAMKKVRRRQPKLHEAFKDKSRTEGRAIYNR